MGVGGCVRRINCFFNIAGEVLNAWKVTGMIPEKVRIGL